MRTGSLLAGFAVFRMIHTRSKLFDLGFNQGYTVHLEFEKFNLVLNERQGIVKNLYLIRTEADNYF